MRRLARSGRDAGPAQQEVRRLTEFMRSRQWSRAEKALDRALALLPSADDRPGSPESGESSLPPDLEEKLRRLRRDIERLVREGRTAAARRLLDEILEEEKQ